MKTTTLCLVVICLLFLTPAIGIFGQETSDQSMPLELSDEIAQMDSLLFDAFNTCQLEKLKSFFTNDLEFFHDKGGLTGFEQTMQSINSMCESGRKVRRELVEGSLRVFPIPDYGAIQEGNHHFYATEIGESEKMTGTFKFVHIWRKENDAWKIARVVSYDH